MAKKAPRRTAERILEVALDLFNRFGEPNVPITLIAAELGISPGNLHYHYAAKEQIVNALFERYASGLGQLLDAGGDVRDVEDGWFFMHTLFESIWQYRFIYRDLNDLLSKNRRLETQLPSILERKTRSVTAMLESMGRSGVLSIDPREVQVTATCVVVVITYWLSWEFVRDPRHALEPASAQMALLRGAQHALNLLVPYLERSQRAHLLSLAGAYDATVHSPPDRK